MATFSPVIRRKAKYQPDGLKFTLFGDWGAVEAALLALPVALQVSARWGQRKATEQFVKEVKNNIRTNKFNNKPPVRGNSTGTPLIDSETYVNNIKSWSKGGIYYAGIKDGVVEPKSKILVSRLALYLEQGTRKMPPRPVWGPTYKAFGGAARVKQIVVESIMTKAAVLKMVGFTIKQRDLFKKK